MSDDDVLGLAGIGAPAVHAALMGFIGYPLATRSSRAMERFHRSGFTWWLITLAVLVTATCLVEPAWLAPGSPTGDPRPAWRLAVVGVVGLVACLGLELLGAAYDRGTRSEAALRGAQRYDDALPSWALSLPGGEAVLLAVTALAEEAVYRAAALSWLLSHLDTGLGVALCSLAFGIAHWYYGVRQIIQKSLVGLVLGGIAVTGNWWLAALVHVGLNLVLVVLGRRAGGRR